MGEDKNLDAYLSVGCPMVLHPEPFQPSAPRYATAVRGWSKGVYLLMDRPKINNRFAALRENQPCIIRFLHNGLACAFDTIILDWDTRQYHSYCRLGWPEKFQTVAFRKFERVKTQLPCTYRHEQQESEGTIEDLSIGGCRIVGNGSAPCDATIELDFVLPSGVDMKGIRALVKNVRDASGQFLLGCQFEAGQAETESDIAFYVTTVLDRVETTIANRQRVLIIDDNKTIAMVLKNLFEQKGIEVMPAAATLDGLSRLRTSSASAVLISQKMADLPGIDSVRLIRATRGLEQIPLYLYGDTLKKEDVAKSGVTHYFDQKVPAIQVAKNVLADLANAEKSALDK